MDVDLVQRRLQELSGDLTNLLIEAEGTDLPGGRTAIDVTASHARRDQLASLSHRSMSVLARFAMVGEVSSGKSAVLSALQGRLEYWEDRDENGEIEERFTGLLPSSSVTMSACPVVVAPTAETRFQEVVGGDHVDILEVLMDDATTATFAEANYAIIRAYLTTEGVEGRRSGDRGKKVSTASIWLRENALPVELIDLPGFGSEDRSHDKVARGFLAKADGFIFTTRANTTLTDAELELIHMLYNEHASGVVQRPVIWIVTAIDSANHSEGGMRAWVRTVERNNELLRERFSDRPHGSSFIGDGFSGVSAHRFARGVAQADPSAQSTSGMTDLRADLAAFANGKVGAEKLSTIANSIGSMAVETQADIAKVVQFEASPLAAIDEDLRSLRVRIDALHRMSSAGLRDLHADAEAALSLVTSSAPGALRALLKREVEPVIDGVNVLRSRDRLQVDDRCEAVCRAFLDETDPQTPPARWRGAFDAWAQRVASKVEPVLEMPLPSGQQDDQVSDPPRITLAKVVAGSTSNPTSSFDSMAKAASLGTGITAAGIGAASAGLVTTSVAVVAAPVAGVLAIGAFMYLWRRKSRPTAIEAARREYREELENVADEIIGSLEAAARGQVQVVLDAIALRLQGELATMQAGADRLESRRREPANRVLDSTLEALRAIEHRAGEVGSEAIDLATPPRVRDFDPSP